MLTQIPRPLVWVGGVILAVAVMTLGWIFGGLQPDPGTIQEQMVDQGYSMDHTELVPQAGTWSATVQTWRRADNPTLISIADDTPFAARQGDFHVELIRAGDLMCYPKPNAGDTTIAQLLIDADNIAAEIDVLKPLDGTKLQGRYLDCIFIV